MSNLVWQINAGAAGATVTLSGPVDEHAVLGALGEQLSGHRRVRLDMADVRRINSYGVRDWIVFLRGVSASAEVTLEKCSPAVVAQMNMIRDFVASAKVASVLAPYVCDGCGHQDERELDVSRGAHPSLPSVSCAQCGAAMHFDDTEDTYFTFLG